MVPRVNGNHCAEGSYKKNLKKLFFSVQKENTSSNICYIHFNERGNSISAITFYLFYVFPLIGNVEMIRLFKSRSYRLSGVQV